MAFTDMNKVENYQFYVDKAIRRAQNRASIVRQKKSKASKLEKSKRLEQLKITIIADILVEDLRNIVRSFPRVEELDEFYKQLIKISIDYPMLKKSLGALNWATTKVQEFQKKYISAINKTKSITVVNASRREFYGRVSSCFKQVKKDFVNIDNARKELKNFPIVKTKLKTVGIAGFPNVGKTTLLNNLTGAKADIANYAFTTKGFNMGYYSDDTKKIQFLDTPGTLNRFNKMNFHEKQAHLALKYLSEVIIYVFDLTETSYPMSEQEKLYKETLKFDKKTYVYLSKLDLIDDKKLVKKMKDKYDVLDKDKIIKTLHKIL